jgi:hypothetical protein
MAFPHHVVLGGGELAPVDGEWGGPPLSQATGADAAVRPRPVSPEVQELHPLARSNKVGQVGNGTRMHGLQSSGPVRRGAVDIPATAAGCAGTVTESMTLMTAG